MQIERQLSKLNKETISYFEHDSSHFWDEFNYPFGDWRDECHQPKDFGCFTENLSDNMELSYCTKEVKKPRRLSHSDGDLPIFDFPSLEVEEDQEPEVNPNLTSSSATSASAKIFKIERLKRNAKNKSWIDKLVDDAISYNKSCGKLCYKRRDVMNKCILRAFRKFYRKTLQKQLCKMLMKPSGTEDIKINSSSKNWFKDLTTLILPSNSECTRDELYEIFAWICNPNGFTAQKSKISAKSSNVEILDSIFRSYSHKKLQLVFQSKAIMYMFLHFMKYGKEAMMRQPNIKNRQDYEEAFSDFAFNFTISAD